MPDVAQWTVTAVYNELQKIEQAGRAMIARLDAQKLALQGDYSQARQRNDTVAMNGLSPIIHSNTVLRLRVRDFIAGFNDAVNKMATLIRNAGLKVPATLSGLGIAPALIIVPATIVVALGILWAIVAEVNGKADAIERERKALLAIVNDPSRSAEDKQRAWDQLNKNRPSGDFLKDLGPILGLVAVIVIAPTMLKMLPRRAA